jgi:ribosomal protein S27AE
MRSVSEMDNKDNEIKPKEKTCNRCGKKYIDPYSNRNICADCFDHIQFISRLQEKY